MTVLGGHPNWLVRRPQQPYGEASKFAITGRPVVIGYDFKAHQQPARRMRAATGEEYLYDFKGARSAP